MDLNKIRQLKRHVFIELNDTKMIEVGLPCNQYRDSACEHKMEGTSLLINDNNGYKISFSEMFKPFDKPLCEATYSEKEMPLIKFFREYSNRIISIDGDLA